VHGFYHEASSADLAILLRDQQGNRVLSYNLLSANKTPPRSVPTSASLVFGIGSPAGLALISNETGESDPNLDSTLDNFPVMTSRIDDLPTEWFGYEAAEAIVLATDDQITLDSLDATRMEAISTWVKRGGHLVISVASRWQTVKESPLGKLLPAEIVGIKSVGRLSPEARSLESLGGDKAVLDVTADGMSVADIGSMQGWALPSSPGGKREAALVIRGIQGFGTVTLLAFDVNAPPFRDWKDKRAFWTNLLDLSKTKQDNDNFVWKSGYPSSPDIAAWIDELLQSFPSVTVVPFSWVALLILGYILLIGPIDYFFLKRFIGKLEWTWITFPILVALVSFGAYMAAYRLKGDKLLINRVELVDIDQSSQSLRGQSFFSIFTPKISRYTVTAEPSLGADGSWADLTGSRASLDRISSGCGRLASWDSGSNRIGTNVLGGVGYTYSTPDPTTVVDAPIPVWSVMSFRSQWLAKAKRVIESSLAVGTINDSTALVGSLTNRLGVPIEDALLIYSDYAYELGTIAADGAVALDSSNQKTLPTLRASYPDQSLGINTYNGGWNGNPTSSPQSLTNAKSTTFLLSVTLSPRIPTSEKDLSNSVLDDWSLRDHARAGRAILIGRTQAPGGKLWINEKPEPGKDPSTPNAVVTQTTLVRIIIEPKPAGAQAP
jgi:hypothetical protein